MNGFPSPFLLLLPSPLCYRSWLRLHFLTNHECNSPLPPPPNQNTQAPDVMRSCSMALQLASTAIGSYMSGVIVWAVQVGGGALGGAGGVWGGGMGRGAGAAGEWGGGSGAQEVGSAGG